jgi:general secretion pathway protein B
VSFILDALRKSESERQRLGGASIADLPLGRRHSQPWWVIAIALLLLANLIMLAIVMLRTDAEPTANTTAEVATSPPVTTSTQVAAIPQSVPARNSTLAEDAITDPYIEYDVVDRATMEAASAVPDGPSLVRSTQPANYLAAVAPDSLPPLRVDMHVYSPKRDARFVFINMRKYLEGQTLSEGPLVEHITASGVQLSYQGKHWELDRP